MRGTSMSRTPFAFVRAFAVFVCGCWAVTPAAAQDPRWEIEAYGGFVAGRAASSGSRTLPEAGPPIATSSPIFPSREVPSWLFGDGASLLNGVNAEFELDGRVTPLDAAFARPGSPRSAGFGARLRRHLSSHWALEIGLDTTASAAIDADALSAAAQATRDSFVAAMGDLLATGPFTAVAIDAGVTSAEGRRRETAMTIALNRRFGSPGGFAPYATFGGGVAVGGGTRPSVAIDAGYRFRVLDDVPIDESDTVTVRYDSGTAYVIVLGGGVQRAFSDRWGLRIDARVLLGPDATRVIVDAAPSSVRGTPAGFVESFSSPAVQFSNDPSIGRVSSLSGPGLDSFEVFKGGTRARTLITVGITRRF
jgi:hypothetical protein